MSGLLPQHGEILLYDNGTDKQFVSVVFRDETFWLTQKAMAELFGCTADNISLHLKNIFAESELVREAVTEKFSATAADGKNYLTQHYNLDAIIAVGYRVNSKKQDAAYISEFDRQTEQYLKGAGVDMTTAEPVNRALAMFSKLLDEMEALTA